MNIIERKLKYEMQNKEKIHLSLTVDTVLLEDIYCHRVGYSTLKT
jgi:hypothetical protein